MLTHEQSILVMNAFRRRFAGLYQTRGLINRVMVSCKDTAQGPLTFDVCYTDKRLEDVFKAFKKEFQVELGGVEIPATVEFKQSPPLRPCGYEAGASINALNSIYSGTVGWFFYLKKGSSPPVLVGVTNWHVACSLFKNETPIGSRIEMMDENGSVSDVASIYDFTPVYGSYYQNAWDIALIRFDDDKEILARMRACQDGTSHPYPGRISRGAAQGDALRKNGATSPVCREGTVLGFGDMSYEDSEKNTYTFVNQIFTTKICDPGDSGSVCVNKADNTVTGLLFASNEDVSSANPMFRFGLRLTGYFRPADAKTELPIFETLGEGIGVASFVSSINRNELRGTPRMFEEFPTVSTGFGYIGVAMSRTPLQYPPLEMTDASQLPPGSTWFVNPPANVKRYARASVEPSYTSLLGTSHLDSVTAAWMCFG